MTASGAEFSPCRAYRYLLFGAHMATAVLTSSVPDVPRRPPGEAQD